MWRWRVVFFILNLGTQSSAYGALGEAISTIRQNPSGSRISKRTLVQTSSYTSVEESNSLYTVTEYANAQGVVFAVSWSGAGTPDLAALFGSYYAEYSEKEEARPRSFSRAPTQIETSEVVVRTFVRMRDLRGLAYVPALTPSGVRPETFL